VTYKFHPKNTSKAISKNI